MTRPWSHFSAGLVLLGAALGAMVIWDLSWRGMHHYPTHPQWPLGEADSARGKRVLEQYGCGACHVIPGIRSATGRVGPKLEDFVDQMYIAGVLTNTPDHLAQWIKHPREVNPLTAMPDLGVTEQDAIDMTAYLYSIRAGMR